MLKVFFSVGIFPHRLSAAVKLVFVYHKSIQPYRSARVDFVGAYPHLRAEAVTVAVGKASRAVPIYICGILFFMSFLYREDKERYNRQD